MTEAVLLACIWLAGFIAWAAAAPWWIVSSLGVVSILGVTGWGWARWRCPRAGMLQSIVDATWFGIGSTVIAVALARWTNTGAATIWAISAASFAGGLYLGRKDLLPPTPSRRALFGIFILFGSIGLLAKAHSPSLSRGLDTGWWHPEVQEQLAEKHLQLTPSEDWKSPRWIGGEEYGALSIVDPEGDGGSLTLATDGPIAVLLRGPIGAKIHLRDSTNQEVSGSIESHPIVEEDEGPVARYLDHGMVAVRLEANKGILRIQLEKTGPDAQLYVLPGREAIYTLDRSGEAQFVHYYQLLNRVENQRWAVETLQERNLTINQPPLWSYVLALPAALVDGEMPAANMLFLFVLLLVGFTGLALLEALASDTAWAGWAIPGLYVGAHFHMMHTPGSTNFPDSLYTAALLGGVLALHRAVRTQKGHRVSALGLAAGLLRYPGTIVITLWAALQLWLARRNAIHAIRQMWIVVVAIAALLAVIASIGGLFQEWLDILWFETGPEHYDNNQEASALWARPAEFYTEWARYMGLGFLGKAALAGWCFLAAVLVWFKSPGRWLMGCALAYSLLLCTIDHFPSHYFLPLVPLMGLSLAMLSTTQPKGIRREYLGLACAALPLSLLWVGGV